ncbi:hypothetical protein HanIR_Chr12g0613401 [Helianthus annuus]|nr:hypothetical protein HanIR_Chr12g0613401 [Helianthus annuus]
MKREVTRERRMREIERRERKDGGEGAMPPLTAAAVAAVLFRQNSRSLNAWSLHEEGVVVVYGLLCSVINI